jgi:F1F0 ATPase subunit 2
MDEKRMNFIAFNTLPVWAVLLGLGVHFVVGLMFGALYFGTLWWNTRIFSLTGHAKTAATLMIGRFLLLGGLLMLTSLEGALPLLATALGVLLGRAVVMRRLRQVAP